MRSLLLLWIATLASGGEWSRQPIEPKARSTHTAYTVDKLHWRIGIVRQSYGLLENLEVGTQAPLFFLGVPNGNAKVTAIQTPRFDVALDGGVYTSSLEPLGIVGGSVLATPVGWTASWKISDRFSLHGGTGWTLASADGQMGAAEIAGGIASVTGADIQTDLLEALGDSTGLYAGANLTLYQTRLSADYRLNRRDSIVLTSNTYVYVSGLLAAGVAVGDRDVLEVEAGASARVRVPLAKSIPSLTTLSWQFDWRRFNLRLGLPLPLNNAFAYLQAFDLYWILGPSRRAGAPAPPEPPDEDTGIEDTGIEDTGIEDTGAPEAPTDPEDTGRPTDPGDAPEEPTAPLDTGTPGPDDAPEDTGAPGPDAPPAEDTGAPQPEGGTPQPPDDAAPLDTDTPQPPGAPEGTLLDTGTRPAPIEDTGT